MARILDTTVSADGNTDETWASNRSETPNRGTIYVFGGGGDDFDFGVVSVNVSPDGGTTFMAMLDQSGTAITFSADGFINFELYASNDPILAKRTVIRLTLAGATTPTVRYIIERRP